MADDVDDDGDDEDQENTALGPLAGFQNLLAAAAAGGNNGTTAGDGEQVKHNQFSNKILSIYNFYSMSYLV